jgi:hypothetical protein
VEGGGGRPLSLSLSLARVGGSCEYREDVCRKMVWEDSRMVGKNSSKFTPPSRKMLLFVPPLQMWKW